MNALNLCGVRVDSISREHALKKIRGFLKDNCQHYLVTVNPEFIVLAQKDKEFREILNQADISLPDGVGIVLFSRFLAHQIKERVTGVDISRAMMVIEGAKIFLLGGRGGVVQKIAQKNKNIVGFTEDLLGAVDKVNQSGANILLVALGAPKQEKWIKANLAKCSNVKVAMGVGGAFDFLAGRIKRAPKFLQKLGLEWLWRLILQPRRLPRIWRAVVVFPILVLKNRKHGTTCL